jgi:hypothetical protein
MIASAIRVRIPTVLLRGERPYVEVGFDDDSWRLGAPEARAACEWMRAAEVWLGSASSAKLADALDRALARLRESPPRAVQDHFLGVTQGQLSSGEPAWLEVRVQSAVAHPDHPRIVLDTAESPDEIGTADTWWIDRHEATQLANLVRRGAVAVGAGKPLGIGALDEVQPGAPPFLHVAVTPEPADARGFGVELRFDDDLLHERGDDGVLWVAEAHAHKLADWLEAAVVHADAHPPHVWQAPEPEPLMVAELR